MRQYGLIALLLAGTFLALFVLFGDSLAPPWLVEGAQTGTPSAVVGTTGVALLVADVFVPVPSSTIMILHGALFGAMWGTALSLVGGLGAALVGFLTGRAGGPVVQRLVSPEEQQRFNQVLDNWGVLSVALTRPVPIVAETVAVLAGTSSMRPGAFAAAAALGVLPTAALYALLGAAAITSGSGLLVLACVAAVALAGHLVARRLRTTQPATP